MATLDTKYNRCINEKDELIDKIRLLLKHSRKGVGNLLAEH